MITKNKLPAVVTICIISIALIFTALPASTYAADEEGDIAINAQNFPDKTFPEIKSLQFSTLTTIF